MSFINDKFNSVEEIKEYCQKNNIFVQDKDNLLLLKYKRGSSDTEDSLVKKLRGLILNKDTLNIVNYTFDSRMNYKNFKDKYDISNVEITPIIDGTMINIYYFNDQWNYSTKGRIRANESRWQNDKSFKELFDETCDLNEENLDKTICYSFLLVHKENRIVVKNSTNRVYLTLARRIDSGEIITRSIETNSLGSNIVSLDILDGKYQSYDDLENYVKNQKYEEIGYMLINGQDRTKITNPEYEEVRKVKGNTPDIWENFLVLEKEENIATFLKYYPEYKVEYDNFIYTKKNLIKYLFTLYYVSRKKYIKFPEYLSKSVHKIHEIFIENKKNDLKKPNITKKIVTTYFNQLHIKIQLHLLYEYSS